jgi:hypothetical protein
MTMVAFFRLKVSHVKQTSVLVTSRKVHPTRDSVPAPCVRMALGWLTTPREAGFDNAKRHIAATVCWRLIDWAWSAAIDLIGRLKVFSRPVACAANQHIVDLRCCLVAHDPRRLLLCMLLPPRLSLPRGSRIRPDHLDRAEKQPLPGLREVGDLIVGIHRS